MYLYRETCFSQKNLYKWADIFKEVRNSIQDEERTTMASTPEMMDLVNALVFTNKRVKRENISEQLGISVGTAYKLVFDDLVFSKVNCI